jgi:fimbrial chaperone protein
VRAAALILLAIPVSIVEAGSLRVAPTLLEIADSRPVMLTITNSGSQPSLIQLEAKRWTQDSGADEYGDAGDIIASPPIFRLEPGAEQTVRIGRRDSQSPAQEHAYRIFVQEVATAANTSATELNVLLRVGVPLFVKPIQAAPAKIEFSLACPASSTMALRLHNSGGRTTRIDQIMIEGNEGGSQKASALYLLAGATRLLTLDGMAPATTGVAVKGIVASGELQSSLSCK